MFWWVFLHGALIRAQMLVARPGSEFFEAVIKVLSAKQARTVWGGNGHPSGSKYFGSGQRHLWVPREPVALIICPARCRSDTAHMYVCVGG